MTLNYVDCTDQSLRASLQLTDATQLTDYVASRGPESPSPNLVDPTIEKQAYYDEVAAILDATYYQIGDTVNWTAPAIDGYQLPNPSSGTVMLGATTNTLDLVYTQPQPASNDANPADELADTGAQV